MPQTTQNKDWKGNAQSVFATNGASSHSTKERANNDYYATDPKAVKLLLEIETFKDTILEPCCGEGHIAQELEKHGKNTVRFDLVDRKQIDGKMMTKLDFLDNNYSLDKPIPAEPLFDIITNPPYSLAQDFIEQSLELVTPGDKIAMFLPIRYLEGKKRRKLFEKYPPRTIHVSSSRLACARNGLFDGKEGNAVCYCWFIWVKGFTGVTQIKWFN